MPFLDLEGLQILWSNILSKLSNKVDYVEGKQLSTNDFTDEEKSKLANIAAEANKTIIDSSLSSSSTNPVQNKVINTALNNKVSISRKINNKALTSDITLNASDVDADASGSAAAALNEAKTYTNTKIADLVNSAPTTLDTLGEVAAAMAENEDVVEALEQAIGTKANASDLTAHTGNTSNPHSVTKAQVGLGNVENKSSATIRGELTKANVTTALGYTPPEQDTVYTHPGYTSRTSGLYKITVNSTGHVSAATAVAKADITALGIPAQDTTYSNASTTAAGLMSTTDKTKLNNIPNPTTSDSGRFLRVNTSGKYALSTVNNAEGVGF